MNTYSDPFVISYALAAHNFATGDTQDIKGPPGFKGRVLAHLLYQVTVAFTATTTSGKVRIGTTADADKHLEVDCATTAIDAVKSTVPGPATYNTEIAADEIVRVTYVAPTGGVPAGTGANAVVIGWYK